MSEQPKIVLTITFDGQNVQVNGPITDKILCYGLLESARDAIYDFAKAQPAAPANGLTKPA